MWQRFETATAEGRSAEPLAKAKDHTHTSKHSRSEVLWKLKGYYTAHQIAHTAVAANSCQHLPPGVSLTATRVFVPFQTSLLCVFMEGCKQRANCFLACFKEKLG